MLGGSWVVISGVTIKATIIIAHIRGLITPLITTHQPPSGVREGPGLHPMRPFAFGTSAGREEHGYLLEGRMGRRFRNEISNIGAEI